MSNLVTKEKQIEILFKYLNRYSSSFPMIGTLTERLNKFVKDNYNKESTDTFLITPQIAGFFTSAGVEMWQRAIHSFMISASLTEVSPIWASICGYYSSHYVVRGLAHLLGLYRLYKKNLIIRIFIDSGKYYLNICRGRHKEHQLFWEEVHEYFNSDPFWVTNSENEEITDYSHRVCANYLDHLNLFPVFEPLNSDQLKKRIKFLSNLELSSVPIPNKERFPDVENVQVIAYHRIIRFRIFIDDILGSSNGFWNIHRSPSWCRDYTDFQVVEPKFLSLYS